MNQRKRTGSDASSGIVVNGNGSGGYDSDLEALKQEILKEVRKELYKVKSEIIDGKCIMFNVIIVRNTEPNFPWLEICGKS